MTTNILRNQVKLETLGLSVNINGKFSSIPDEVVLNPSDIAIMLNISKETVRRWCREGKLDCYNWGGKYVICASDFKRFLQMSKKMSKLGKLVLENE